MTLTEFMQIDLSMGFMVVVCLIYTAILILQFVISDRKIHRLEDEIIELVDQEIQDESKGWVL